MEDPNRVVHLSRLISPFYYFFFFTMSQGTFHASLFINAVSRMEFKYSRATAKSKAYNKEDKCNSNYKSWLLVTSLSRDPIHGSIFRVKLVNNT